MHLLALTHLFYPARGGTEIALLELSKKLVEKGHRVTVLTSNQLSLEAFRNPQANRHLAQTEWAGGIQICRLPLSNRQRLFWAKLGALFLRSRVPWGNSLWFMTHLPYLPQMISRARALKPDILYAVPFPTATSFYACLAAKSLRCPWVIQPHLHPSDINDSLRKIIRWLFPLASAVVVNTRAERDFLINLGLSEGKLPVIGQGIDLTPLQNGRLTNIRARLGLTQEPLILFLGRKVEKKGLDTLLKAMPFVWNDHPDARLIVAGQSSPYFQALWHSRPETSDRRIISLDDFAEDEKARLLAACDLLVLPSQAESFGIVFLEAWALGKPVIGARVPAVEALIDEEADGLLVPFNDPSRLGAQILRLINDPNLRKSLGEAGRRKVETTYEIHQVADRFEALLKRLGGTG
jgi:glycosyltransferase involved in cell wall biosynthesis